MLHLLYPCTLTGLQQTLLKQYFYNFPVTCLTSLPWLVLYVIRWPGTSMAPGTQVTLSILWVTTGNWTLIGGGRGTVDRRQMTINILSVPLKRYCARDVDNRRKRKRHGKKICEKWKEATMAWKTEWHRKRKGDLRLQKRKKGKSKGRGWEY